MEVGRRHPMLVLTFLLTGIVLGYLVPRRAVALGLSVALWLAATGLVLVVSGVPNVVAADAVGVLVMLAFAPVGCGLGVLLRARRSRQPGRTGN
jgi:hypothetical protein